jgi:hypothetical protein
MPAYCPKSFDGASAPEGRHSRPSVQTRRAEALPGFPFAAPLHKKEKGTPGEAPDAGGLVASRCKSGPSGPPKVRIRARASVVP